MTILEKLNLSNVNIIKQRSLDIEEIFGIIFVS